MARSALRAEGPGRYAGIEDVGDEQVESARRRLEKQLRTLETIRSTTVENRSLAAGRAGPFVLE